MRKEQPIRVLSSECRNKRLQYYDWWKNFFDQPIKMIKQHMKILEKIDTGQRDDYTTGCFLDYTYFRDYYKMIAIDLSKQQAINFDPKAI